MGLLKLVPPTNESQQCYQGQNEASIGTAGGVGHNSCLNDDVVEVLVELVVEADLEAVPHRDREVGLVVGVVEAARKQNDRHLFLKKLEG